VSDCARDAADTKRRELQARIADVQLEVRPGKRIRLAASAGASVFPHDGSNYESLLADADHRMYRDKASRRASLRVAASSPDFVAPVVVERRTPRAIPHSA